MSRYAMPDLILGDIDSELLEQLRARATAHGRSIDDEHRLLLREALLRKEPAPLDVNASPKAPRIRRPNANLPHLTRAAGLRGEEKAAAEFRHRGYEVSRLDDIRSNNPFWDLEVLDPSTGELFYVQVKTTTEKGGRLNLVNGVWYTEKELLAPKLQHLSTPGWTVSYDCDERPFVIPNIDVQEIILTYHMDCARRNAAKNPDRLYTFVVTISALKRVDIAIEKYLRAWPNPC